MGIRFHSKIKLNIVFCLAVLFFFGSQHYCENLLKIYKKGAIKLIPDPEFGDKTDWGALFYKPYKSILVAEDGSIFVANSRTHNIYKFDNNGNFLLEFGKKGKGPGDFIGPKVTSFLAGKYIVVSEYALNRRINLFDLAGNFHKLLITNHSCFSVIGFGNRKVAYLTRTYLNEKKTKNKQRTTRVIIKDIESGVERVIVSFKTDNRMISNTGKGGLGLGPEASGMVFITDTNDGNLLVGYSQNKEFNVYSPDGKLIRTFNLDMKQIFVTKAIIKKVKERTIKNMEKGPPEQREFVRWLKTASFDPLFPEYYPYYKELMTDSEGNILVFNFRLPWDKESPNIFQVYSPEGEFVCETSIVNDKYKLEIDQRFRKICFNSNGIIALVDLANSEDYNFRLIKVNFKKQYIRRWSFF